MLSAMLSSLGIALLGALWAAALSTFGDWVWARFIPAHRAVYGLAHGTLLFLGIGAFLGAVRRRLLRGALLGAAVGFGAAGGFYALAPLVGYAAMFVLWMALWAALAIVDARGLSAADARLGPALARGGVAAVASGLAFYAISGIWTTHRAGGPDYPYNFACWTIAFLPGFLALLARRS
jgi:hypothetical protein